jgi:hypothetical protein
MHVSEVKHIIEGYKNERKLAVLDELQQLDMLVPSNTSPEKVSRLFVMCT